MQTVAYQGIPGSFSYQAARMYFKDDVQLISESSFDNVFMLLEQGDVDLGILPVENSSIGIISRVYDLLSEYDMYIMGELYLEVEHNLLALPGARLEDIEEVYSHPQAIEQCNKFLSQHPGWKVIPFFDTAKSAKWIREKGQPAYGAIASVEAAQLYKLEILSSDIHDNPLNYTRFVVIAREGHVDSSYNKISLNISLSHRPGSLYKVVEQFAKNDLNMLNIQSRPIVTKPFEYMFYIDFEGNLEDESVKKTIEGIKHHCSSFKVIGNYKAGDFNHIL